ncbi:MAG TPA: HypC/HybG/HupF family hydrogenase formation chaperone [Ktedonobacteraceae bacterium]|nr:HypC/HybG/HupF family hydrogenase formation chaperone [Ktedonobacteraceae bacterium]
MSMEDRRGDPGGRPPQPIQNQEQIKPVLLLGGMSCSLDHEGHCITCSDEAVAVRVRRVEQESGLALVEVEDTTEEVDITLVEHVSAGTLLLVHGGVAIAVLEEAGEAGDA